ncbi:MAG: beta-ketoacyl-ACP synthase II [Deinococcales bacterium]
MLKRVVVTGLGVISPIGNGHKVFHEAQGAGKSGVRRITRFDVSHFPSRIAGEVDLDIEAYLERKQRRRLDPYVHYALISSQFALEDSGLAFAHADPSRIGVIIGSGIGGMESMEENFESRFSKGPLRVSPFFIPMMIANMASAQVAIRYGFMGPNTTTVSACTSGADAIGHAMRAIQWGEADVMVAGGAEAIITPIVVGSFSVMKALSTRNDSPETASRPFSASRDGFVLGEGAAVLILESLEHAKARDANIYAELKGFGRSADAYHMTEPHPEGLGAALAMQGALKDAQVNAEDIGYINAHATSTSVGDIAEGKAIKKVFAAHAKKLAISSTKSMTGHLLGAAGAIEAVATIQALTSGILPPTINYQDPDPELDLDYIPNVAREQQVELALSNSFGFGGQNAALIFGKI